VFTGLVSGTGSIVRRDVRGASQRLLIDCAGLESLGGLELGESVAVCGVCLTVAENVAGGFAADLSSETIRRTNLGDLALGSLVNLERSLRVGDRLGGHFVTGHIDAVAHVVSIEPDGDSRLVRVEFPRELRHLIARKGSVALDGVSLTVNAVAGSELSLMLIPHTLAMTSFKLLAPGSALNLEVDLLARYAAAALRYNGAVEA
jgi:riboflavin synthase